MKNEKIKQSLENLKKALLSFKKAVKQPHLSELERAGAIQRFEFCYELCWKTLKKISESEGRWIASPRNAFRYALESNWILNKEEPIWVEMIYDRNQTTHTYDEQQAKEIYQHIKERYFPVM